MFKRKKKMVENPSVDSSNHTQVPARPTVDFTESIDDDEERDEVTIIASAILSTHYENSQVRVKSVRRVNQEKRDAAIIAASVLAHDRPDQTFRLVSIEEKRINESA